MVTYTECVGVPEKFILEAMEDLNHESVTPEVIDLAHEKWNEDNYIKDVRKTENLHSRAIDNDIARGLK